METTQRMQERHSGSVAVMRDARSARILAKTIFRELQASGADDRELLAIATEFLGLIAKGGSPKRG